MRAGEHVAGVLADIARAPSVGAAVEAARELLDMEVAATSRLEGDHQVFEVVAGPADPFGLEPGLRLELGASHCRDVLLARVPEAVLPEVRDVPPGGVATIAAFASVPLLRGDGSPRGTLCCMASTPRPGLTGRDVAFLRVLARIVVDQLEREELQQRLADARVQTAAIDALVRAVDARDAYTAEHSMSVVALASRVAGQLGLDGAAVHDVERVALLHDLGKLGVPDAVLGKPGPLAAHEEATMRLHPGTGAAILAGVPELAHLAPAVRAEHERWDGQGYPDGLAGEEIPVPARIVLVCDAYHAMTSVRPYRLPMAPAAALQELRAGAGSQFWPAGVAALLEVLAAEEREQPPSAA